MEYVEPAHLLGTGPLVDATSTSSRSFPPNIVGDAITLSAALIARPEVIIGPTAPAVIPTPLPPLQNGPVSDAFHAVVVGSVTWNDATTLLAGVVKGKKYSAGWFKDITVDNVNVLGNGNTMIVALQLSGDVSGTIYLQGTPTYVRSVNGLPQEAIEVPDLDYTIESRNVLANVADWVLHSELREDLRSKATFPLTTRIEEIKAKLQTAINRPLTPTVKLSGNVSDVTIRGVYLSNGAITVQAVANGTTSVTMN